MRLLKLVAHPALPAVSRGLPWPRPAPAPTGTLGSFNCGYAAVPTPAPSAQARRSLATARRSSSSSLRYAGPVHPHVDPATLPCETSTSPLLIIRSRVDRETVHLLSGLRFRHPPDGFIPSSFFSLQADTSGLPRVQSGWSSRLPLRYFSTGSYFCTLTRSATRHGDRSTPSS